MKTSTCTYMYVCTCMYIHLYILHVCMYIKHVRKVLKMNILFSNRNLCTHKYMSSLKQLHHNVYTCTCMYGVSTQCTYMYVIVGTYVHCMYALISMYFVGYFRMLIC